MNARHVRSARALVLAAAAFAALAAAGPLFAQAPAGKKYAVLVGVKQYDHAKLRDLDYPVADVTELADLLGGSGYQVTALTSGARDRRLQPTLANINARLAEVLEGCKKYDTVLVALSGHGLQFDGQRDAFFCPQDAKPLAERTETLLSLAGLYRRLDDSGAGVKLLLVDACRDDPKARGARGASGDGAPRPPRGVSALFSCSAGEESFESDKLRHGVFFHYVLRGLKGEAKNYRGEVTWDALQAYVRDQVSENVPELIGGGVRQTPSLSAGELAGRSPVLLAVRADSGRRPADTPRITKKPAPAPPAAPPEAPEAGAGVGSESSGGFLGR
jgi:uncharacterized caspase-like protein